MYPARVLAVTAVVLGAIPSPVFTVIAFLIAAAAAALALDLHRRVSALEKKQAHK